MHIFPLLKMTLARVETYRNAIHNKAAFPGIIIKINKPEDVNLLDDEKDVLLSCFD